MGIRFNLLTASRQPWQSLIRWICAIGREFDHPCAAWTLANDDLRRRVAPRSYRGTLGVRRYAEACKTYVSAELVKTLKPDDIVVLDNLK
jgi:hypothetical protein